MDPFCGAPTVAIVLADRTVCPSWMEDAVRVAGNLLNAARSVGVDSCCIFRAKEGFASPEGLTLLREWGLNENCEGAANCIACSAAETARCPRPPPERRTAC